MSRRETTQPMDFLGRIIAKAQGVESAIAPRVPSRFEPTAGGIGPSLEDFSEQPTSVLASKGEPIGVNASPRAAQRTTEARAVGIPHLEVTARRDEAEEMNDAGAQITEKAPYPVVSLLPSARAPDFVERMVTRESRHAAMRAAESDWISGVGQQPSAEALPSSDMATGVRRTAISVNARFARDGESAPGGREELRLDPPDPGHKSGALESDAALTAPLALIPRIGVVPVTKLSNDLRATSLANEREPQTPVIHVTIGRVEVRAVQAPAVEPRIEPVKPKPLGLDDYLKQRGGRR